MHCFVRIPNELPQYILFDCTGFPLSMSFDAMVYPSYYQYPVVDKHKKYFMVLIHKSIAFNWITSVLHLHLHHLMHIILTVEKLWKFTTASKYFEFTYHKHIWCYSWPTSTVSGLGIHFSLPQVISHFWMKISQLIWTPHSQNNSQITYQDLTNLHMVPSILFHSFMS